MVQNIVARFSGSQCTCEYALSRWCWHLVVSSTGPHADVHEEVTSKRLTQRQKPKLHYFDFLWIYRTTDVLYNKCSITEMKQDRTKAAIDHSLMKSGLRAFN